MATYLCKALSGCGGALYLPASVVVLSVVTAVGVLLAYMLHRELVQHA